MNQAHRTLALIILLALLSGLFVAYGQRYVSQTHRHTGQTRLDPTRRRISVSQSNFREALSQPIQ